MSWADSFESVELARANTKAVSLGRDFRCVVETNGQVACAGSNLEGQLGNGVVGGINGLPDRYEDYIPVQAVAGAKEVVCSTAIDDAYACALLETGRVKCWGNAAGLVGASGAELVTTAQDAVGLENVIDIEHSLPVSTLCAVLTGGEVRCWGGAGFTAVSGLAGATAIEGNLVIGPMGQVFEISAVGGPNNTDIFSATPVPGVSGAVAITKHAVWQRNALYRSDTVYAIKADGTVLCWHECPLGGAVRELTTPSAPTVIPGLTNVRSGSASCTLSRTGEVWCWGRDSNSEFYVVPARVATIPSAVALEQNYVLTSDGSLWWASGWSFPAVR